MKSLVLSVLCLASCASAPVVAQQTDIPADTEIQTTESGLKYSVLAAGAADGKSPTWSDIVVAHYTGWMADGTYFDSSHSRGEPMKLPLGGFVEGWNEALQLMKPGDRWKLTIPPELGYGDMPPPGSNITAGATLVFEMELLNFYSGPGLHEFVAFDDATKKVTEGGLEYQELAVGTGPKLKDEDVVLFHYTIFQMDGSREQTSHFMGTVKQPKGRLAGMPFFGQALEQMTAGSQWLCKVPPELSGQDPAAEVPTVLWRIDVINPVMPKAEGLEWTKTDTGLEFTVLEAGDGVMPKAGETVEAHYSGWLLDGTLFDSSAGGAPAQFALETGLIDGWVEGLQLVPCGSKVLLRIPAALGYADKGRGAIPPGATLMFEIDLFGVVPN